MTQDFKKINNFVLIQTFLIVEKTGCIICLADYEFLEFAATNYHVGANDDGGNLNGDGGNSRFAISGWQKKIINAFGAVLERFLLCVFGKHDINKFGDAHR